MVELRHSPRINVTWRGVLKIDEAHQFPIRVLNVSSTGILIQSVHPLKRNAEYQIVLEIPQLIPDAQEPYVVPATMLVLHSVLSGESFRAGVRITEIAELYRDLMAAWISLASRYDAKSEYDE